MTDQDEKCYACGRAFRRNGFGLVVYHPAVLTRDGQRQFVGFDCYEKVRDAGPEGWQPPRGGPRLFLETDAPPEVLAAAGVTITRGSR